MTLAEAAKLLGVSADYLRVAANRGVLKAEKVGRDWLVTPKAVEAYRKTSLGQVGKRGPKKPKNG